MSSSFNRKTLQEQNASNLNEIEELKNACEELDEIASNLDTEKSELMSEVKKLRAMPKEDVSIKQQRGEKIFFSTHVFK